MNNDSTRKIILKSLGNAVITWLVLSLLLSLKDGSISYFAQNLGSSYSIGIAVAAFAGSFIGFWRKSHK